MRLAPVVRRHPHIAIIAAVSALALALTSGWVLLTPAHHDTREALVPLEPSVSPTADATPSPASTPEPSPTVTVDVAPPNSDTSPASTSSPAPTSLHIDADHLLSDTYLDNEFGSGRRGFVGTSGGQGAQAACFEIFNEAGPHPVEIPTARIWSWPGEVVVGETFARATSSKEATATLQRCRAPRYPSHSPDAGFPHNLDLGDESFVRISHWSLASTALVGVRVGRDLVFLVWRQTGTISDTAPLVRAAQRLWPSRRDIRKARP